MFLLHKNAPRGCDQMHKECVRFVLVFFGWLVLKNKNFENAKNIFRIPIEICIGIC